MILMNIYQNNVNKYSAKALELTKTLKKRSVIRVIAFVLSIAIIIILVKEGTVILLLIAVPICMLGFGLLVNNYNQLVHLKQHTTFLKEINEFEILPPKSLRCGLCIIFLKELDEVRRIFKAQTISDLGNVPVRVFKQSPGFHGDPIGDQP